VAHFSVGGVDQFSAVVDNCYDNACAESFFGVLKRERIRRKVYPTREAAKSDIFNSTELFYNSVRRHGYNDVSPKAFEDNSFKKLVSA